MSSQLATLARVVHSAKVAAARSAPAAIVGPLQKILGCPAAEDSVEEQQEEVILEDSLQYGILSGLARAEVVTTRLATAPVDSTFARNELREFQQDYYRRAVATTSEPPTNPTPDLSVPVGDEYLYLAQ